MDERTHNIKNKRSDERNARKVQKRIIKGKKQKNKQV
jgi:hypothetical protein